MVEPTLERIEPTVVNRKQGIGTRLRSTWILYAMMVPGILTIFLFRYVPIFGIVLAFKDYNALDGILGSRWVGLQNFRFFVESPSAWRAFRNTLILNISFLLAGQLVGLVLALYLNEIRGHAYKRITQSFVLLPHFMSWMVVGIIAYNILSPQFGLMNRLLTSYGFDRVNVFNSPSVFPFVLLAMSTWKSMGYSSVIFLATLSGISPELYEAATIDGATRQQRMWYVSVPLILPAMVILILLGLGNILNMDFGMFLALVGNNALLYPTSDVLGLFIYRSLRQIGDIGMASAAGLFRSVVGFLLVIATNWLVRTLKSEGALF